MRGLLKTVVGVALFVCVGGFCCSPTSARALIDSEWGRRYSGRATIEQFEIVNEGFRLAVLLGEVTGVKTAEGVFQETYQIIGSGEFSVLGGELFVRNSDISWFDEVYPVLNLRGEREVKVENHRLEIIYSDIVSHFEWSEGMESEFAVAIFDWSTRTDRNGLLFLDVEFLFPLGESGSGNEGAVRVSEPDGIGATCLMLLLLVLIYRSWSGLFRSHVVR